MSVQSIRLPRAYAINAGLLVLLGVAVAIAGFHGALWELVHRWTSQEEYGHGFLIPVVAAWLLWTRRDALAASVGEPSWAGFAVILFAMVLHVVGELSAIFLLSQLAFIIATFGLVLSCGGYSLLKATFVPIIYLIFAIPLPYFIEANLSLQLQLISSQLGVSFIKLFSIPVYLDGNVIDLGYYKLQVVDACSGLRYLYPLLSLSFLAAYLFRAPLWQRALVLLSSIPITIAMNGLRIGIVGVTVDRWGTQMADGVLHFFEGWIIFMACSALLALEIYLLALLSGRRFFDSFGVPQPATVSLPLGSKVSESRVGVPLIASVALLFAIGLSVSLITHRPEIIPERTPFATFPTNVGSWQGRASMLEPDVEQGLKLDDYLLSDFARADGKPVNLYVAYYSSQRKGESPHSPLVCIPGDGWTITSLARTVTSEMGEPQPVNRATIARNSEKQLVYYWYEERGRKIANEYWSKWYLLSDALTKNRTDGALVRLITQVFPGETEHDADERVKAFMRDVVPSLKGFLPGDSPEGKLAQRAN